MKFSRILKCLVLALSITCTMAGQAQSKEVIKFAQANQFRLLGYSNEHIGTYPYLGVLQFYLDLPEIKGKYEFKHVGNVYKSPNECLNAVATGAVQITYSTPSFLEQFNENWNIASTPGIFDNFEHFQRTVDSPAWQKLVTELEEKQNIKVIKWIGNLGRFMLYANKPIDKLEDAAGLRIRYNGANGYVPAIKNFGMTPVALPFTEVVSALQTNMIDGLLSEIGAAPYYDLSRYAKHLVPINWVASPMCLVVNAQWWNSLDADSKAIFTYAFMTPSTYQFLDAEEDRLVQEWGTTTPNTVKSNFSPEETKRWEDLLRKSGQEFLKDAPKDLMDAAAAARAQ